MSEQLQDGRDGGGARRKELRLALGMRGGVSLAVWIGGACAEVDELRRAADEPDPPGGPGFWRTLLRHSPYERVTVDVMAGASAGGLNGVVFAAAVRHGFRMTGLRSIWLDVADVAKLVRRREPYVSLFDGDRAFLDEVDRALRGLVGGAPAAAYDARYVDLQLSATLVEPVDAPAVSPDDERLRRTRSSARFHFRHDPDAPRPRRDLDADGVPCLATAARATASFPFAFEAAVVRAPRPASFAPPAAARPGCQGVFSEVRQPSGPDDGDVPADAFLVQDGGVLDNIPLGKALDAVKDAPASGPTRRVLVYLHPTGPAPATDGPPPEPRPPADRRGPEALVRGLIAARLPGEGIDVDIERIEDHDRRLALARMLRSRLAAEAAAAAATPGGWDPVVAAAQRLATYRARKVACDAQALVSLLSDPLTVLGEDPFPVDPLPPDGWRPEDRWRAPLAMWPAAARRALDDALLTGVAPAGPAPATLPAGLLHEGLGPLERTITRLIEWIRAQEALDPAAGPSALLGDSKRALYRLRAVVAAAERARRLSWVIAAGRPPAGAGVAAWVAAAVAAADGLLAHGPRTLDPDDVSAYLRACDDALQAGVAAPATPAPPGGPDPRDLRDTVLASVVAIVEAVLGLGAGPPPLAGPAGLRAAAFLDGVLRAPGAGGTRDRLAALEVLCFDEALVGDPSGQAIGFARLSAAAETIDADRFTALRRWSEAQRPGLGRDRLLPGVKLAGETLSSFSAFFDRRWRENDWAWGRLDAVPTLVDLLLGDGTREALGTDQVAAMATALGLTGHDETREGLRRALIRHRQDEILDELTREEGSTLPATPARWTAGIETLDAPGGGRTTQAAGDVAAVAGLMAARALPATAPRLGIPLSQLARRLARRVVRPRGWPRGLDPDGLPRPPTPPAGLVLPSAPAPHGARLGGGARVACLAAGVTVAGAAWAIADSPVSYALGAAAGLAPGAVLLWATLGAPGLDRLPAIGPLLRWRARRRAQRRADEATDRNRRRTEATAPAPAVAAPQRGGAAVVTPPATPRAREPATTTAGDPPPPT